MSSNKTNKPASTKSNEVVKQEDVVVAVLVADSFNVRFAPVTETTPKALLPLVNRPMIEYSLESLLLSGVQKTYIYCVSHADKIRQYLKESKWMRSVSPMTVEVLSQSSDDCRSLGDALRDIDGKSFIRGDFILLSADVISNVQLVPILEKHRETRKVDKGTLMTHIFRKTFPGHRSRSLEEEVVLVINPNNGRILNYQQTRNLKKLNFPLEMFKENAQVELRHDLVDTHISICSPVVLPLFSDNFDYQSWGDFVKGILVDEEILDNTIYYHELEGSYAAQVSNVSMYDAVSKDIIQRWAFPLVPDLNGNEKSPRHSLSRHNVYKQPNVTLAKGSVLEMDVVVGQGSIVGERTFVTKSVIGSRCTVGNDVHIKNAYIWNDVVIKDKCRIEVALISDGVILNEAVELGRGCVIGPGVSLAAGTKVPENTRLMAHPPHKDDDDFDLSDDEAGKVAIPITTGSVAYVYEHPKEDDSDTESLFEEFWGLDIHDDLESEDDEDDIDEDDDENLEEDIEDGISPEEANARTFYNEVLESLQRANEEKFDVANLILEINSSKHAYNITMKEVVMLVVKALLSLPATAATKSSTSSLSDRIKLILAILKRFLDILKHYLKSNQSQIDALQALEDHGNLDADSAQMISKVIHYLYQIDVLSEDAILEWFDDPLPDSTGMETVREKVKPFIDWLNDADEESSD